MPKAPYQDFKLSQEFVKKYITPFVRPNGDIQSAPVFIEFAVRDYVGRNAFYLQKLDLIRKRDIPKLYYIEDLIELTPTELELIQGWEKTLIGHRIIYDSLGVSMNIPGAKIDFSKWQKKEVK